MQVTRIIESLPLCAAAIGRATGRLFGVVLVLALSGCSAAREEPPMLSFSSQSVGFTQIDIDARETRRNEQGSAVEFVDNDVEEGNQLAKDAFRLRALATVAARRGFDYFVVLDRSADSRSFLLGMLSDRDTEFADAFGAVYADLPRAGILEVRKLAPFELP